MLGNYKMSIIGTSHLLNEDGVCQDASDVIVLDNGWIVAAVADGVGSSKKSEIGSSVAVKTVLSFVRENYPEKWHEESLISLLRTAYNKSLKEIKAISIENHDETGDYDTTLTTVIYNGANVVYGHVGDGGVIALSPYGDFSALTKVQKGEAFNETFVLRAGPENWQFGVSNEEACALTLMTDGMFDIAYPLQLAKTDNRVYVNYIRPFMDINLLKVKTQADFENVQAEICDFLCSEESKAITDDKTIVGIINTDVVPEIKPVEYYAEPDWKTLKRLNDEGLYGGNDSYTDESGDSEDENEFLKTDLELWENMENVESSIDLDSDLLEENESEGSPSNGCKGIENTKRIISEKSDKFWKKFLKIHF